MDDTTWKAVYANGGFLSQFNEDETENKYPDIDRSKLIAFEIYKHKKLLFRMDLEKDMKLVCRRRTKKDILTNKIIGFVYIVGWHRKVNGKSEKKIAFVHDDGHVEFKLDWEESNKWHSSPILRPEER